ncbi:hypothetical protein HDU99_007769 [Rhizoclosmatium hyalinum]|nr:hypothetical protein HDU99_007769 [Rhizoclosmatium hyalinum]
MSSVPSTSVVSVWAADAVSPWDVAAVYPLVSQNSFFGIGEKNAVSWTNNASNPLTASIASLSLVLGTGSANNVQELYPIGALAFPASTCFTWTPTANLTKPHLATPGAGNYPTASSCDPKDSVAVPPTDSVAPPPSQGPGPAVPTTSTTATSAAVIVAPVTATTSVAGVIATTSSIIAPTTIVPIPQTTVVVPTGTKQVNSAGFKQISTAILVVVARCFLL